MSELRIEPTDATLGATVTGVSLAALTPDEWSRIERKIPSVADFSSSPPSGTDFRIAPKSWVRTTDSSSVATAPWEANCQA